MTFRFSLAMSAALAAAAVFAAPSYAWQQNGAGGTSPPLLLWGAPGGGTWGMSHFSYAPPGGFGAVSGFQSDHLMQPNAEDMQRIENDLSQWEPGFPTASWWQTVGRAWPIPRRQTGQTPQTPAPQNDAAGGFVPPSDGQPLRIAPERAQSKVLQFNPQTGKLEDAKVIRW